MTSTLLLHLPLLTLSILLLWKGSDWLVDAASSIAYSWGVSDLVIGLSIVAIGTSAPEFAVTTMAALAGKADISVSNIVGSNIFNLGFILGGTACFHAIVCTPKVVYRDGIFLILVTLMLGVFLYGIDSLIHLQPDPTQSYGLSIWEGIFMMLLLAGYLSFLFLKKEPIEEDIAHEKASWKTWALLFLGLVGVVGGGHLLVESASSIAKIFGVSDWVIGVTIVAAGTSAPEFAASMMAVARNKHGMAIGNLIGSDLFNLLGVLGLAAILGNPLVVSLESFSSVMMLIIMVTVVIAMMRVGWKVSRIDGAILLGVNLFRWYLDFSGTKLW